jgi:hypothetical protein
MKYAYIQGIYLSSAGFGGLDVAFFAMGLPKHLLE